MSPHLRCSILSQFLLVLVCDLNLTNFCSSLQTLNSPVTPHDSRLPPSRPAPCPPRHAWGMDTALFSVLTSIRSMFITKDIISLSLLYSLSVYKKSES